MNVIDIKEIVQGIREIERADYVKKELPEDIGCFIFSNEHKLYVSYSANISKSVINFFDGAKIDKNKRELIEIADKIEYETLDTLFEAFLYMLIQKEKHTFPYNKKIENWKDFAYLSINMIKPPFVKLAENTNEDSFYIGPFWNRFLAIDAVYTVAELMKIPVCESKDYPCDRLKEKKCEGFCLSDNRDELIELLEKYIILPNVDVIHRLEKEYEKTMDNLKFISSDLVSRQLYILKKYYRRLRFLFSTKDINMNFKYKHYNIKVENGLIREIKYDGEIITRSISIPPYRENELLAVNKNEVIERWVVYKQLVTNYPDEINQLTETKIKSYIKGD